MKYSSTEEIYIQGTPISEGIAMGVCYFLPLILEEITPVAAPMALAEVDKEIHRYRNALFSSKKDLEQLQCDLVGEGSADAINIIDSHIQMLKDPLITTRMEQRIRETKQKAESVFRAVIHEYKTRFARNSDVFFEERFFDVMDVSKRILGHLHHRTKSSFSQVPCNSIVFTQLLDPSDMAGVHISQVAGFVTQMGGSSSHAALIARSKGIPCVTNVDMQPLQHLHGKYVILDGLSGAIIINPHPLTLKKYEELYERLHEAKVRDETNIKAETADGHPIKIYANICSLDDVEVMHRYQAKGVGLFRSEFLCLESSNMLHGEEVQSQHYRKLVEGAKGLPVVIRVFDVGADKCPEEFKEKDAEGNPLLGCRGIRFLLRHQKLFKIQLRAIMRATAYGDVRILLPLVSDTSELTDTRRLIEEVEMELEAEGVAIKKNPALGCMIEMPSAAVTCDLLASCCDFLSIGTNDLIQYTLGIDRNNPGLREYSFPAHPSILRMIKMVVTQGHLQGKPVTLCGESASNPLLIPVFLGLGIEQFSCAPRYIPVINKVIRNTSLQEARAHAEQVLKLVTPADISLALSDHYRKLMLRSD